MLFILLTKFILLTNVQAYAWEDKAELPMNYCSGIKIGQELVHDSGRIGTMVHCYTQYHYDKSFVKNPKPSYSTGQIKVKWKDTGVEEYRDAVEFYPTI